MEFWSNSLSNERVRVALFTEALMSSGGVVSGVLLSTGSPAMAAAGLPAMSCKRLASGPVGGAYVKVTLSPCSTAGFTVRVTWDPVTDTLATPRALSLTSMVKEPAAGVESWASDSSYARVSLAPSTNALACSGGVVSGVRLSTGPSVMDGAGLPAVSRIGLASSPVGAV